MSDLAMIRSVVDYVFYRDEHNERDDRKELTPCVSFEEQKNVAFVASVAVNIENQDTAKMNYKWLTGQKYTLIE